MPTLGEYRRALAVALNDLGQYLVTAATADTLTIIEVADSTAGASTTRYDGRWVYVASGGAGVQRRVKTGGYNPATGVITLELTWLAPVNGDRVEITSLFPADQQVPHEDAGYRQIVNRALSLLTARDRVALAVVSGQDAYPTTAWPWLDHPDRLLGVLEASPVAGRGPVACDWRGARLVLDGSAPFLELRAPFTGTLTLDVARPGHTLISGAESTVGLGLEPHTAIPSVDDVRTVGLWVACDLLATRSGGRPDGAVWAARAEAARAEAEKLVTFDRTRMRPAPAANRAPGQEAA